MASESSEQVDRLPAALLHAVEATAEAATICHMRGWLALGGRSAEYYRVFDQQIGKMAAQLAEMRADYVTRLAPAGLEPYRDVELVEASANWEAGRC